MPLTIVEFMYADFMNVFDNIFGEHFFAAFQFLSNLPPVYISIRSI